MKLFCLFTIVLTALFVGVSIAPRSAAQTKSDAPEQILLQSANRERAARNLASLKWSTALAKAAQQHASLMAQRNTLSHQFPEEPPPQDRAARAGARFSSLAENVAEGPSAENLQKQWMESAPHRANLLDPQLDSVGIGVAERNGTLFAVEDFSLAGEATLGIGEQEKMVNAQLQGQGLRLLNEVDNARRSCVLDNGFAGSHVPSFVLHYATSDLRMLPDLLQERLRIGRYHSAVVGACPADGKTGSANYRVAVLLYEQP